ERDHPRLRRRIRRGDDEHTPHPIFQTPQSERANRSSPGLPCPNRAWKIIPDDYEVVRRRKWKGAEIGMHSWRKTLFLCLQTGNRILPQWQQKIVIESLLWYR